MAESVVDETDHDEIKKDDVENSGSNDVENSGSNTSILAGINLVLIVSLLSLPAEDRPNFDEIEERESSSNVDLNPKKKQSAVAARSDFRTRSGFRAIERQSSKVTTKVRDCRHCRRL